MASNIFRDFRQVHIAVLLKDADHRHADRHQGRLRILGQGQLLDRAFKHQFREILRERLIHLLKDFAGDGMALRQLLPHTDGLAALAGKYKCTCHISGPILLT